MLKQSLQQGRGRRQHSADGSHASHSHSHSGATNSRSDAEKAAATCVAFTHGHRAVGLKANSHGEDEEKCEGAVKAFKTGPENKS